MITKIHRQFLFQEAGEGGDGGSGAGSSTLGSNDLPADHWASSLPDEFKSTPFVREAKDLSSFVKSAVETKKMVGADTVKIPGEKATDEERAQFYAKLGRPEKPEEYSPSDQVKLKEGLMDEAILDDMKKTFHEAGISKSQAQKVLDTYFTKLNEGAENMESSRNQKIQEGLQGLQQEWGDDYTPKLDLARQAVKKLGGDEFVSYLNESGLGDDPRMIKVMAQVGELVADDQIGGSGGMSGSISSTGGALAEINRLNADSEFIKQYTDHSHPQHKQAVERMAALRSRAYPGKAES